MAYSMLLRKVMKALPKILLALTAVAALSVAYPAKANLITNPGFEMLGTGWTFGPGTFIGTDPNFAHSGSFYAGGFDSDPLSTISQSVATTPGANYTIDFFVSALFVPMGSNFIVTFGGTVFSHLFAAPTNGYIELTFNATASGANTTLSFRETSAGLVTFSLDDISVEPAGVGVPDGGSTVSLLGFVLLGLAAFRRKLSC
jgi:hypothetical protein